MQSLQMIPGVLEYAQGPDALDRLLERLPGSCLFVGGARALELVRPYVRGWRGNIRFEVFDAFPGEETVRPYLAAARAAEAIVGVGGGRAIDAAKTLAARTGAPFFTLPTQAATCAAATRLYVHYTPEGRRWIGPNEWPMEGSIQGCYADTRLLATSPRRYLCAGIADGFAKLSEAWCCELVDHKPTLLWRTNEGLSRLLTDLYYDGAADALAGDEEALGAMWYATLGLTGAISALGTGRRGYVLAHALYDSFCDVYPELRAPFLHGEAVAVGVLLLLQYLNVPGMPYEKTKRLFERVLGVPTSLDGLGLREVGQRRAVLENMLRRRQIPADSPLAGAMARAMDCRLDQTGA